MKAIRGPQVRTARNIFAPADPAAGKRGPGSRRIWMIFLAAYDWTVPMAMPLMESVPVAESDAWLARPVRAVSAGPGALNKTIFLSCRLKTGISRSRTPSPDQQLVDWMRTLQLNGVNNYGYYPDDFLNNQPDISKIRPLFFIVLVSQQ